MRLFLGLILFDLVYSNLAALTPVDDWCRELGVNDVPLPLPDPAERAGLARTASKENPHPVLDRVVDSFATFPEYFTPWPDATARKNVKNPVDACKFAHCWIATRLRFFENLVLARQGWAMFAPNVLKNEIVVRARLVYADGSEVTVRSIAEPSNIVCHETFRGFLTEKLAEYSTTLNYDSLQRLGYCNLLAHRHALNSAGSPLVKIQLIIVRYDYPEPGEDARAVLGRQMIPLGEEPNTPFFEYDVRSRSGRMTGWWTRLFSS